MMNKLFKSIIFSVCFLMLVNICFAQKTVKVDLGKLRQNTYTNDFFGLKVEFPLGWLVGDNKLESQIVALQKPTVQTKDPKNQKALNAAMNRVTPLLGGYKALPGSVAENSNLRIMVESLATMPTIKTDLQYLQTLRNTLNLTTLPMGFAVSAIKNDTIDGKVLPYIEIIYNNIQRRSYALVKKRFAVIITIDAYNQKEFDELHKVLQGSDLDYKPQK